MDSVNPWLETLGVVLLVGLGVGAGHLSSRLRKPWWLAGYLVPLGVILLVGLGRVFDELSAVPPFSWLLVGRARFAILGPVCTTLLVTPVSRLPGARQRRLVGIFCVFVVCVYSLLPFVLPAILRERHLSLPTRLDEFGVCIQSTDYTCGPAAAVTALRRLGFSADEGELTVLSHTTPAAGTPPDLLCEALEERYGDQGLSSEFRRFSDVDALREVEGITLAVVRHSFLVDHYVVVLEVQDGAVVLGDPSYGRSVIARTRFEERWRFSGVVLSRR